jgi:hypothetical protein
MCANQTYHRFKHLFPLHDYTWTNQSMELITFNEHIFSSLFTWNKNTTS